MVNTTRPDDRSDNMMSQADSLRAPLVVKIGGRALEGDARAELAREVAALTERLVLVHGGGAEVSEWSARLGIEPRFHDGLRVTDQATLEVAAAVLGGLANKRWVALLAAHGVRAAGLCALDAGIADVAMHRQSARLGAVGEVRAIDTAPLLALLGAGITPVLAPIGACDGEIVNINADDLAAAVAGALQTPVLVLLSDTPGLVLDGRVVPRLDPAGLTAALAHADVTGGMRPKLLAAQRALDWGAARVIITAWNGPGTLAALATGAGTGTTFVHTLTPAFAAASPGGRS
jgi:acetylglutamate kinase